MKQSNKMPLPRRHFLQQLVLLGGATGVGAMALKTAQLDTAPAQASKTLAETAGSSKGYRLTEHIRTYYTKAQL